MRIAIWHNLPSGGAKRALHQQVTGLLADGHYMESWCPPSASQTYLPLSGLIKEHVVDRPGNLSRLGRMRNAVAGQPTTIVSLEAHCRRCATEMNEIGFDLLLANVTPDVAVPPIGLYFEKTKILSLQEPNRTLYEASPTLVWSARPPQGLRGVRPSGIASALKDMYNQRFSRALVRQERLYAACYDRIVVNSFYSSDAIRRVYGLNSTVCYLGVDTEKFADLDLPRLHQVVGVGELAAHKRVDFLVRAVATISENRPSLLWIANKVDPDYLSRLQSLADQLQVQFDYRTNVTDTQLITHLNQAAVFVYSPSLEPFGLAALEASSCATPVVGVAEAGLRETIVHDETGLLTQRDPTAFGSAVAELLNDPARARRLGTQGAERTRQLFSIQAAAKRFNQLIDETAAAPRLPRESASLSFNG